MFPRIHTSRQESFLPFKEFRIRNSWERRCALRTWVHEYRRYRSMLPTRQVMSLTRNGMRWVLQYAST